MSMRFAGLLGLMTLRFLPIRHGGLGPEWDARSEGPLTDLPEGEEGVIVEVAGASRLTTRLREMGAVPGARVRVHRTGCPTVIQVEEGRFCLRRRDAGAIRVRPVAG